MGLSPVPGCERGVVEVKAAKVGVGVPVVTASLFARPISTFRRSFKVGVVEKEGLSEVDTVGVGARQVVVLGWVLVGLVF